MGVGVWKALGGKPAAGFAEATAWQVRGGFERQRHWAPAFAGATTEHVSKRGDDGARSEQRRWSTIQTRATMEHDPNRAMMEHDSNPRDDGARSELARRLSTIQTRVTTKHLSSFPRKRESSVVKCGRYRRSKRSSARFSNSSSGFACSSCAGCCSCSAAG